MYVSRELTIEYTQEGKSRGVHCPVGFECDTPTQEIVGHEPENDNAIIEHHLVVMKHTGLKDAKGEEIWESDLVSFAGEICLVSWHAMQAAFTLASIGPVATSNYIGSAGVPIRSFNWLDGGEGGYLQLQKKSAPVEVIGNIHQHPHLLTQPA